MIPVMLRGMAPRLVLVGLAGLMFYLLEPSFHQHGPVPADMQADLGPHGLAASLSNLAGLSMLVLLGGFISTDRRRGYYRLFFAHPVSPLAFYGLRWAIALGLALLAALIFLVGGQLAAWGELRGGWSGLGLALLSAVVYGGVIAFLSALLPRGDAWVAVVLFLFNYFWLYALSMGIEPFAAPIRQVITFLLPPQTALQDVYQGLVSGQAEWGAAAFSAGYGLFWLVAAGLLLRMREWP
jgi:hypothetical protein